MRALTRWATDLAARAHASVMYFHRAGIELHSPTGVYCLCSTRHPSGAHPRFPCDEYLDAQTRWLQAKGIE